MANVHITFVGQVAASSHYSFYGCPGFSAGPWGAVTRVFSYRLIQSVHHSTALLPDMSYKSNPFSRFSPTGCRRSLALRHSRLHHECCLNRHKDSFASGGCILPLRLRREGKKVKPVSLFSFLVKASASFHVICVIGSIPSSVTMGVIHNGIPQRTCYFVFTHIIIGT